MLKKKLFLLYSTNSFKNNIMEDSKNNKPVIYRCDGVNCRKKKGKILDYYIKKYKLKNKIEVDDMDCNNKC
jgi:hypothetical protein